MARGDRFRFSPAPDYAARRPRRATHALDAQSQGQRPSYRRHHARTCGAAWRVGADQRRDGSQSARLQPSLANNRTRAVAARNDRGSGRRNRRASWPRHGAAHPRMEHYRAAPRFRTRTAKFRRRTAAARFRLRLGQRRFHQRPSRRTRRPPASAWNQADLWHALPGRRSPEPVAGIHRASSPKSQRAAQIDFRNCR